MRPGAADYAVYYAVDDNPRILAQLRYSVTSIRRFNPSIPIYVASSADRTVVASSVAEFDVRLLEIPKPAGLGGRFLQKWTALAQGFPEDQLLFLDADTIVGTDVEELFRSTGPQGFHARLEPGCVPGPYPIQFAGRTVPQCLLDHDLFQLLNQGLGGQTLPVFNTGVMLFKNGLHRLVAARIRELLRLRRAFASKSILYPCARPRLLDEILGSLILGRISSLSWKVLPPEVAPFYEEVLSGAVPSNGMVLHVWSNRYADYLAEHEGPHASQDYLAVPHRKSVYDWLFNAWLRAGVVRWSLPRAILRRWARRSRGLLPPKTPA